MIHKLINMALRSNEPASLGNLKITFAFYIKQKGVLFCHCSSRKQKWGNAHSLEH